MTDQPKWTPGPWVAHDLIDRCFTIHRHGVRPGYAERIADIIYWNEGHSGPKGNPLIAEASANARLIAAAPELYAALAECADDLEAAVNAEYGGKSSHPALVGKYDRDMEPVRRARAALAKARGDA